MIKITKEFTYEDEYSWRTFAMYLLENTWQGARKRVLTMEEEEVIALFNYLDADTTELTDVQLNDFIWFDWDEIYEEIKKENENNS